MKKIALCLVIASIYGTAQANSLSIANLQPGFTITKSSTNPGYFGSTHQPYMVTGNKTAARMGALKTTGPRVGALKTTGPSVGALKTTGRGTVTFTYLGQDSGYKNGFRFGAASTSISSKKNALLKDSAHMNEQNKVGDSISQEVTSGIVDFQFWDDVNSDGIIDHIVSNGDDESPSFNFVFLQDDLDSPFAGTGFYDDSFHDFQFILGFNDSSKSDADYNDYVVGVNYVPAVPLPAALPLMASAVGLIGVGMRRRKAQ